MIQLEMKQFTKQIEAFAKATEQAIEKTFQDIVVEVGTTVIRLSPVLTGRFRGNWQMTVGAPSSHSLNTTDPEGDATIADLKIMAATLTPGEIAYIANNLTYGYNIETTGWQVTPPYMPVRRTKAQFDALVKEAIAKNRVTQ